MHLLWFASTALALVKVTALGPSIALALIKSTALGPSSALALVISIALALGTSNNTGISTHPVCLQIDLSDLWYKKSLKKA